MSVFYFYWLLSSSFCGQVLSLMTLPTLQPLELPQRCCSGHQTWWTTSCACSMSCPCSSASVSSRAVGFLPYLYNFILCNLALLWLWAFFWGFIFALFCHRDSLCVPRAALHLLLSHSGQCLSAVRGGYGLAAGHSNCHDRLHDQSELLPSWQSAGVSSLEKSRLCWR